MRSLISLLAIALLGLLTVNALATPEPAQCVAEYCVDDFLHVNSREVLARIAAASPTIGDTSLWTNAQRMARGLPPKPPVRRGTGVVVRAPADSRPSGNPTPSKRGNIVVKHSVTGTTLGYLSKNTLTGYLMQYSSYSNDALDVSFLSFTGSASAVRITMGNLDISNVPLLGLVQGKSNEGIKTDVGSGSVNYLYLNGVASPGTGASSKPTVISSVYSIGNKLNNLAAETDVWTIDLSTGLIAPQWVNSNSGKPATSLWVQNGAIYAGGDIIAFQSKFPNDVTPIALYFEED